MSRKYSRGWTKVDAGIIAGDVVRDGKSIGWSGPIEAKDAVAKLLEPFNIHYTDDMLGEWTYVKPTPPAPPSWLTQTPSKDMRMSTAIVMPLGEQRTRDRDTLTRPIVRLSAVPGHDECVVFAGVPLYYRLDEDGHRCLCRSILVKVPGQEDRVRIAPETTQGILADLPEKTPVIPIEIAAWVDASPER